MEFARIGVRAMIGSKGSVEVVGVSRLTMLEIVILIEKRIAVGLGSIRRQGAITPRAQNKNVQLPSRFLIGSQSGGVKIQPPTHSSVATRGPPSPTNPTKSPPPLNSGSPHQVPMGQLPPKLPTLTREPPNPTLLSSLQHVLSTSR